MITHKYTPGPWETAEGSYGRYVTVRAGKKTICRVPWGGEDGANAELIAAAPALVEALEDLLRAGRGTTDEVRARRAAYAVLSAVGPKGAKTRGE